MATTNKKPTEVQAVQTIHQALESFDAQARSRILRAVTSLLEVAAPVGGVGEIAVKNPALLGAQGTNPNDGGLISTHMRIDTFVSSKNPITTYQRLACLAYYLEHHEQTTEMTGKDLAKANAAARQSKISNVSVFLNDATAKYGFFASVGGGKKSLTARGAALVEALPDQAAVKQTLQSIPAPRRSGRRPKSKAK